VNEVAHIAGEDNSNCDRLSRREQDEPSITVDQMAEEMGIGGTRVLELGSQKEVLNILRMCDSKIALVTESDFIVFWKRTRNAISDFLTLYPTSPIPPYDDVLCREEGTTNPVPFALPPIVPTPPPAHPSFSDYTQ
jgi:hypothetical protein